MSKKPNFRYRFNDEESASRFLEIASNHYRSAIVQHPQMNGIPNRLRVFVTGSGSLCFDLLLKEYLDEKAKALGGTFEPQL